MPKYDPEAVIDLLQPGDYDAVVKRAENRFSDAGNEMIALVLTCYTASGAECDVFDYLVFSQGSLYRVKQFCDSSGLPWGRGQLDALECVGKNVRVAIKIEKSTGYADKNKVAAYIERLPNTPTHAPMIDADVPF